MAAIGEVVDSVTRLVIRVMEPGTFTAYYGSRTHQSLAEICVCQAL